MSDYTEVSFVEAELRVDTNFSNDTTPTLSDIRRWISEESKIIELRTGRSYGYEEHVDEVFDYNGEGILRLPESTIVSVSSLSYRNNRGTTWIELTEGYDEDYIVHTDTGEIEFLTSKATRGSKRLKISYVSGSYEVPLEIQRLCTLAVAKRVVLSLVNNQSNAEGGSIQVGTIRITDPSNFSPGWVRGINSEMDYLYKNIGDDFKVFRLNRVYD